MTQPVIIDDPEKGTSEQVEGTLPLATTEPKPEAVVTVAPVIAVKKPARKVSRWVAFQLWFNTYRYVANALMRALWRLMMRAGSSA